MVASIAVASGDARQPGHRDAALTSRGEAKRLAVHRAGELLFGTWPQADWPDDRQGRTLASASDACRESD